MAEFEFGIRLTLPQSGTLPDESVQRLGEIGCDDAIVGIGRRGQVALDFTRDAESAERAVLSAIADVKSALPGALLVEVTPDLVGLTDVGRLLGVTRQNVRKLLLDGGALAPVAAHEGKPALWHLETVLEWLVEHKDYRVPDALRSVAHAALQVNLAIAGRAADVPAQRQILALLR